MDLKLGIEIKKERKGKAKLEKFYAQPYNEITHEHINRDLYMPAVSTRRNKETEEIEIERHYILTFIQEQLKDNGIAYDLGLRVVDNELQFVIQSDIFKEDEVKEQPEFAAIKEYMEHGEFVVRFTAVNNDNKPNFVIDDEAPTEYWLSKISLWDEYALPTLKSALGTVGKVGICAYFTKEGLNFETITNRYATKDGEIHSSNKKIKGFSPQEIVAIDTDGFYGDAVEE